jgi:NAD(P)-dependent dehydrogenase (short-subunit alcohol dehydrogenase family)
MDAQQREVEAAIVSATALGRVGQPADVAGVVAFLAYHDARWITGATIEDSGGYWLGPGADGRTTPAPMLLRPLAFQSPGSAAAAAR